MLGWEFPPFISGGLGTACYGLTRALSQLGTEVIFVLPRPVDSSHASHVKMASPSSAGQYIMQEYYKGLEGFDNVVFRAIPAAMKAYQSPQTYQDILRELREKGLSGELLGVEDPEELELGTGGAAHYGQDLFQEVHRYARLVSVIARNEEFDVIHAHDWMTYPAGIAAAKLTGKPLVVHIHSTEFDRSGEHVHQHVYDIERSGLHQSDRIVAVSYLTRSVLINRYGVYSDKIEVVYNAIEKNGSFLNPPENARIEKDEKIVLFLGRITMQKGPEYFLGAAKKVLEHMDDVKFVMAGSGDLIQQSIEMAAGMGIGHKVLFTGFLRGDDVDRVFRMADLFVMPSVSEPFGLVPLEALRNDVPVIISKQSGVAEVLHHVLKVDFWDIDEMANKIIAVLRHQPLQATLREHGNFEVRKLSWTEAARRCNEVYESMMVPA